MEAGRVKEELQRRVNWNGWVEKRNNYNSSQWKQETEGFKIEMKQWQRDLNKNKQKMLQTGLLQTQGFPLADTIFVSEIVVKG